MIHDGFVNLVESVFGLKSGLLQQVADGSLKAGSSLWWRWTTKLEVVGVMGTLPVMEADGADFLWI